MGTKLAVRRLEKRVRKIKKPTILLLESATLFTPQPMSELDAAATKVQKVYKSYRTRSDLADCAALVEKLWWQTLDFAALKRSSVSFYNIEKHDSADRSGHGLGQGLPIGKGLCEDEKAQKLAPQHWLEAIDPLHRYGHNLHFYHDVWSNWLDVGDSKYTNLTSAQEVLVYNFNAFSILDQKRGRHMK